MEQRELLKTIWETHSAQLFLTPSEAEKTFEIIWDRHSEKHRKYHNYNHLIDFFEKAIALKSKLERPENVFLAIWFHDIIYNPLTPNNELKSAKLAHKILSDKSKLSESDINSIYAMIISTSKHEVVSNEADNSLFLDLDLSILGSDQARYQKYAEQIRQEFKHVPLFLYRKGRKKILQDFMNRAQIFYTKLFHEQYEQKARQNITWEISSL